MTTSLIAGRYSRDAEVGRGGMGAVWRGTDQVLGRTVALKRIGVAPGGATPDAVRAEREARLAARLNDPHVVSVYDLVEDDTGDGRWLVMEYVEGTDLAQLIRSRGELAPDEVAPILAQAASALAAAHASGIVHRDVKPSNILVTPAGHVKLSDFGIARTDADAALTQTGLVTGSPAYLAPEVASGQHATPPSDVWSLGATLCHALQGHPPYDLGDNLIGGLYRIVHEPPPRPEHAGWLMPMLLGTMTHDPGERWTAAQAQTFLESGVAPAPLDVPGARSTATSTAVSTATPSILAPDPTVGSPAAPAASTRHRETAGRAWWLVAVAALVVVALTGWAVAVGFGGSGNEGTDRAGPSSGGTTTSSVPPSASASPSASGSAGTSADPTADAMTSFLGDYLRTVVSDREAAFADLTPAYQQHSGGLRGYRRFWDPVSSTTLVSATADPASLTIDYRYRYVRGGKTSKVESHRMRLEYVDGHYLIADQV